MTHLLANLGWVDFDLGSSPRPAWAVGSYSSGPPAGGTSQIKVNPTEVRQQMFYPVQKVSDIKLLLVRWKCGLVTDLISTVSTVRSTQRSPRHTWMTQASSGLQILIYVAILCLLIYNYCACGTSVTSLTEKFHVPWSAPGCRAGNGGKLSNSLFDCLTWICLGAAYFLSISSTTSWRRSRPDLKIHWWWTRILNFSILILSASFARFP